MQIVKRTEGEVLILEVHGDVDVHTMEDLQRVLNQISGSGSKQMVLDCGSLTYIGSPGLALLVKFHDHFQKTGGNLALVAVPSKIRGILEVTRMAQRFVMFPHVEDALARFHTMSEE